MGREEIIKSWYKDWLKNIQSVHSIFVHTYGEDRVDLQCDTMEAFSSAAIYLLGEKPQLPATSIRDELFSMRRAIILVLWPEVTIENERSQSHLIKELYAKIQVNGFGMLAATPSFSRAHYNIQEWFRDYAHSHLPGIPGKDASIWLDPCFGTGPINATISGLVTSNDWELWMLLSVQLDQFVHVESLGGIPYRALGALSGGTEAEREYRFIFYDRLLIDRSLRLSGNPPMALYTDDFNIEHLREFTKEFCSKFHQLGLFIRYDSGFYNWGSSFVDTVTAMSDLFIEWFNNKKLNGEIDASYDRLLSLGILKQSVLDGNAFKTPINPLIHLREQDYVPYIGLTLFPFKREPVSIKIDREWGLDRAASNTLTILNTSIVIAILISLLKTINICYGFQGNFTFN